MIRPKLDGSTVLNQTCLQSSRAGVGPMALKWLKSGHRCPLSPSLEVGQVPMLTRLESAELIPGACALVRLKGANLQKRAPCAECLISPTLCTERVLFLLLFHTVLPFVCPGQFFNPGFPEFWGIHRNPEGAEPRGPQGRRMPAEGLEC